MGTLSPVGLIGIGLVGTALAENLLARGFPVVGYDLDAGRRAELERRGGVAAASPAEAASRAPRVLLSLRDSATVLAVLDGLQGLLRADPLPRFVIDTTTGDPETTEGIAARLAGHGIRYLDAPLAGSSDDIRARDAAFLVGTGTPEDFAACADLFHAITERAFPLGPPGSGARAKLVTNLVLGLNRLALAEGLVFGERLGIDPAELLALLKATSSYSRAMDIKGEKMLTGDFTPQARLAQHRKDVGIILATAEKRGQPLPLSQAHRDVLDRAIAAGDGDLDNSAVIRELRRQRRPM